MHQDPPLNAELLRISILKTLPAHRLGEAPLVALSVLLATPSPGIRAVSLGLPTGRAVRCRELWICNHSREETAVFIKSISSWHRA